MDRRFFRVLLYLLSALMDCVTGIFIFIGPVRATILGYDPLVAGSMVSARAICCCLGSFIISRFLTSANSVPILLVATVLYFGNALLGLLATNLTMLYVTSAFAGLFMVAFSASFQIFMKDVVASEARPLSRVVGSYTFAWCVGMSFGPFITGLLMEIGKPEDGVGQSTGWMYAYLAAAILILFALLGELWIRRVSSDHMRRQLAVQKEKIDVSEGWGRPDLAWLGWVMAVAGTMVLGVVRAVFPSEVTRAGMPEWRSGLMMTLVAVAMGCIAYLVSRSRTWMYSGVTMLGIGGIGFAGMLLYILPRMMGWELLDHSWQFYLASILAGGYSGVVYLYSCYHALAHPQKAGRNVSLNETFLAGGMTIGTFAGGWVAKHYGFYPPFVIAAVLVLALALFQFAAHRKYGS